MTILSVLATIVGSAMALSGVPQAIKIFKRKSAGDISALTYIILILGGFVFILYGIEIRSLPIIVSNGIGLIVASWILIGWSLYGRNKKQS